MSMLTRDGLVGQSQSVGNVSWSGGSGHGYLYQVFELPVSFPAVPGNYIFAKVEGGYWRPIYIGETENMAERFDHHHKAQCILLKGATHIHAHLSGHDAAIRRMEEQDILAANRQAYQPIGCNG